MDKDIRKFVQTDRQDFAGEEFSEFDTGDNPIKLFESWLQHALAYSVPDPSAFTLATASKDGIPSARVVYMRDYRQDGLVCYTNYGSDKANDLDNNPQFCGNFYWHAMHRQVRFSGTVERLSEAESDDYFAFRPRESQLGAWASKQSNSLPNRAALEDQLEFYRKKFEGETVPRPPFWGGYLLRHNKVEFWQGRESRLHDRLIFVLNDAGEWEISRLSP